jgi:DNA-binding NarL/FixJ family response regulator
MVTQVAQETGSLIKRPMGDVDRAFGCLKTNVKNIERDSQNLSVQELMQLLNQVNNNINISIFIVSSKSEELSTLQDMVNNSKTRVFADSKKIPMLIENSMPQNKFELPLANNVQMQRKTEETEYMDYREIKRNRLTQRENEILHYIAMGYLNKQIALTFGVSEQTIKNQVTSILRKLNAESRTGAVANAVMKGLITFPSKVTAQ